MTALNSRVECSARLELSRLKYLRHGSARHFDLAHLMPSLVSDAPKQEPKMAFWHLLRQNDCFTIHCVN
jgi:hypothetical protein